MVMMLWILSKGRVDVDLEEERTRTETVNVGSERRLVSSTEPIEPLG
jgi:hypothetical protein